MKLLINIPKEFEQHFQADRFEDSLHRLSHDAHLLAGLYEQETAMMLIESFKNAVPIPPHGDLIDRRDLKNKEITIDYDEWDDTFDDGLLFVTGLIDNAPIIIEAEEEES